MTKAKSDADSDCKSRKDLEEELSFDGCKKKRSNIPFLKPFSEIFKGFGRRE